MTNAQSGLIKAVTLKSLTSILILLFSIFTLSSCALFGNSDPRADKSREYQIEFSDSLWTSISPDVADTAFLNNATGSIITSNSQCKKYEKTSLDQLAENILRGSGIEGLEIIEKKPTTFSEREAMRVIAQGKADGVKTYLSILTLRKNRCVYDFILVSNTEKSFKKDQKAFEVFLKTVKIK